MSIGPVIVLTYFLLGAPYVEREYRTTIVESAEIGNSLTPFQCMQQGQLTALRFLEEHPGVQIVKWKCEDGNRVEHKA